MARNRLRSKLVLGSFRVLLARTGGWWRDADEKSHGPVAWRECGYSVISRLSWSVVANIKATITFWKGGRRVPLRGSCSRPEMIASRHSFVFLAENPAILERLGRMWNISKVLSQRFINAFGCANCLLSYPAFCNLGRTRTLEQYFLENKMKSSHKSTFALADR